MLHGGEPPCQQLIYTEFIFTHLIYPGNDESLSLIGIRIFRCYGMSDDVALCIKAEVPLHIEDELVANLRLLLNCSFAESQQLINVQLILSRLRVGLYD